MRKPTIPDAWLMGRTQMIRREQPKLSYRDALTLAVWQWNEQERLAKLFEAGR